MDLPKKWWQWLLIYPTLFIALGGNVPQLLNRYDAWKNDIPANKMEIAKQQRELWVRNVDCIREDDNLVYTVKTKTNDTLRVAACNETGDIIVEVHHSNGEKTVRWIAFDTFQLDVVQQYNLWDLFGVGEAVASEPPVKVKVICQKFVDKVYLFRRVDVEGVCMDEVVNTYTGAIVMREEIECQDICKEITDDHIRKWKRAHVKRLRKMKTFKK